MTGPHWTPEALAALQAAQRHRAEVSTVPAVRRPNYDKAIITLGLGEVATVVIIWGGGDARH